MLNNHNLFWIAITYECPKCLFQIFCRFVSTFVFIITLISSSKQMFSLIAVFIKQFIQIIWLVDIRIFDFIRINQIFLVLPQSCCSTFFRSVPTMKLEFPHKLTAAGKPFLFLFTKRTFKREVEGIGGGARFRLPEQDVVP